MTMEYQVVAAELLRYTSRYIAESAFSETVASWIAEGWRPQGGISVTMGVDSDNEEFIYFAQAMVRDDNPPADLGHSRVAQTSASSGKPSLGALDAGDWDDEDESDGDDWDFDDDDNEEDGDEETPTHWPPRSLAEKSPAQPPKRRGRLGRRASGH